MLISQLLRLGLCGLLLSCARKPVSKRVQMPVSLAHSKEADHQVWLQRTVDAVQKATGVPALGAVVVHHQKVVALAVAGSRKSTSKTKVTTDDLWQLGSITKTFTAGLIERLVHDGLLHWHTTLRDIYPELPMDPAVATITLQELANHTSGLARDPEESWISKESGLTLRQRRSRLVSAALRSRVGAKRHAYSNLGYHLLGAIAEKTAAAQWEALILEKIAKPSGMKRVRFGEARALGNDQPAPHVIEGGSFVPVKPKQADVVYDSLAPAGHITVDLHDGAKHLMASLTAPSKAWFSEPAPAKMGRRLSHVGSNGRNLAIAELYPDASLAVLVVTNSAGPPSDVAVRLVKNDALSRFGSSGLPAVVEDRLEGEHLALKHWSADLRVQTFSGLSGGQQLWWAGAQSGEWIELEGRAPPGRYILEGRFCFARDYGALEFEVQGAKKSLSFHAPSLGWESRSLGTFELPDGRIKIRVTAKNSTGEDGVVCHLGLDHLELKPVKEVEPVPR